MVVAEGAVAVVMTIAMKDMRTRTSMKRKMREEVMVAVTMETMMTTTKRMEEVTRAMEEIMVALVVKIETIQAKMRKTTKIMTARRAQTIPVRRADRMTIQVLKENMEEVTTRIQAVVMTRVMTPPVKRIEEAKAPATTDRDTIIRVMMRKDHQEKGAAVMIAAVVTKAVKRVVITTRKIVEANIP
ncbi:MAG: hypothetical protein E6K85_04720 [Thaumarchaeota archaeon]|nr:MAG: hypothetical protein E6K85_04720 [Nitrososphaerota archaeon]